MAPAVAISLYYLTLFAALGLFWPFLSLYLKSIGLGASEITRLMSVGPLLGMLTPLAIALLADARRARVWLLRLGSVGAALSFVCLAPAENARPALYAAYLLFAICRSPLTSLVDATAVEASRRGGASYGRLRLWGSIGFLVAVAAGGALFEATGYRALIPVTTAILLAAAASAWAIPAPSSASRVPPPHLLRSWATLLRTPDLALFLLSVVLAQTACAAYDGCFSLHLQALGFGGRFIGAAWATGVAAEVFVLSVSGQLVARFGAEKLLAFSFATATVRWLLVARVTSAIAILVLQPLHGITFGCFYVSGVLIMRGRAERETATTAQGLFSAAVAAGTVIGMSVAGRLLEERGGALLFTVAGVVAAAACACSVRFAMRSDRRALTAVRAMVG